MKSEVAFQSNVIRPRKHGVTEKKKAELDALTNSVLDAQLDVQQYQAMVDSLSEKSIRFQIFLQEAEAERTRTLNNRNLLDNLVQAVNDLLGNSSIGNDDSGRSDSKTN